MDTQYFSTMKISWNEKFDRERIVTGLKRSAILQADNNIRLEWPEFNDYEAALTTALVIPDDVPDIEKQRIIRSAITATVQANGLSWKTLWNAIGNGVGMFLQTPPTRYVLLTYLSIDQSALPSNVRMSGTALTFSKEAPVSFQVARKSLLPENMLKVDPRSTIVRALVEGRSPSEAGLKAITAIDLIRGIWNLDLNRAVADRKTYPVFKPVNAIRQGPAYTLHKLSGELAISDYWYELLVAPSDACAHLGGKWVRLRKFERWVRKQLAKCPSQRGALEKAICNYSRAFDEPDADRAFQDLWMVLEQLTATGKGNYETTVRRASFVWTDTVGERQVLHHLRETRNALVHRRTSAGDPETHLFQLKRYVEALFASAFVWVPRFGTLDEFGRFLDLSHDSATLKRDLWRLKSALRFRTRHPEP